MDWGDTKAQKPTNMMKPRDAISPKSKQRCEAGNMNACAKNATQTFSRAITETKQYTSRPTCVYTVQKSVVAAKSAEI